MVSNEKVGEQRMRRFLNATLVAALVLVSLAGASATALASGNDRSGFTVGDCMSDVLYGNEPNMANGALGGPAEQAPGTQAGNVVSTQSPGPWVNNPTDPENPTRGKSAGQWNQLGANIPALCRAAAQP
jgi:hypothetical protein